MYELHALLSKPRVTAADLGGIYAAYRSSPGFNDELIRLLPLLDPECVYRPLGLLRMRARSGNVAEPEVARLIGYIDSMTHWVARLLCCQLLSVTGCPQKSRDDAFDFLADCFRDRRVIIRAWALTALNRFTDPPYQKSVASMLALARKDPSKAMQARLRKLAPTKIRTPSPPRHVAHA